MKTSAFVNEIGNKVSIKVKRVKGKGSNAKTNDEVTYTGTEITIAGSATPVSGPFTLRETVELYEILKSYLDSIGKLPPPETPPTPPVPPSSPEKPARKKRVAKKSAEPK